MGNAFQERKDKLDLLQMFRKNYAQPGRAPAKEAPCSACGETSDRAALEKSAYICPRCGAHMKITAKQYFNLIYDENSATRLFTDVVPKNPTDFPGYEEKLQGFTEKTGLKDACLCADGRIGGMRAVCAVLDSRFFMGSMGTAVGEKITRAAEFAKEKRLPLVMISASGGARMQEGIYSLFQMAKTSAAIKRFSDAGGLFISYLTHPTTGGVTASFAYLGDLILAEPGALIGFAGPRVIEQTIGEKLPEGFQRSEFLLEHGFLDGIVPRNELRDTLIRLISLHTKPKVI